MTSDSERPDELEAQAVRGDRHAMAALFEQYRPRLACMIRLRMDRRLQGRVAPSDVLQEAYLDLPRRMATGAPPPAMPFFLWLRMVVAERLLQIHRFHLGTAKRNAGKEFTIFSNSIPEASSISLADHLLGQLTSPSQAAMRSELQLQLQEVLNAMEPIDREVLALRHFEELSNGDVALVLGITKAAASKRYVQALRRLRVILVRIPGFSDDA